MIESDNYIPKATLSRLPAYLRYLKGEAGKGIAFISSSEAARDMGLSAVSVRKDLSVVSAPGKPHVGFEITTLIQDIEKLLGYHRYSHAVVVGAGKLGRAILSYEGFENYGLHVVGAFDVSPAKIGAVDGKPVYPLERLNEIVTREGVEKGVITVPKEAAQTACDMLVGAGVRAILNFAPVYLSVPNGVQVKYVDLAATLASLGGAPWSE